MAGEWLKELLYRRGRAVFFAFDLLWLNGTDLRQTPVIERKKKLQGLIQRSECSEIIYAQHVERDGKLLFKEVCDRNLEGIVAKQRTGVYSEHGWLKIKNPHYTQSDGRREMFETFSRTTEKWQNCFAQNLAQKGVRLAQIPPKIAYHYHSKLLIPCKAGTDFRFTNRLLYH